MSNPSIKDYLKYSNLQMASEAFLVLKDGSVVVGRDYVEALVKGNKHASVFTSSEAEKFVTHWVVVDQKANTTTGFSGTLFKCIKDDPATGAKAGELVLSFRSTEFIDDSARDNLATNTNEIKETGWAWGQIADMEKWYAELRADPAKLKDQAFSVTGYSLGGHLATAFNLLHEGAAQQVVTFNGAGVGLIKSRGLSLQGALNVFTSLRDNPREIEKRLAALPELANQYRTIRSHLADKSWSTDKAVGYLLDLWRTTPTDGVPGRLIPLGLDAVEDVLKALLQIHDLEQEVSRLTTLRAGGTGSNANEAPNPVPIAAIEGTNLDYRMAVILAGKNTSAASVVGGAWRGLNGKVYGPVIPGNQFDVVGDTAGAVVANSQWHIGTNVPVFIEDQPLFRGGIGAAVGYASAKFWDIKLLAQNYAIHDFGDTHSLVLLNDSLSTQNTLAQLMTPAQRGAADTDALLKTLLRDASNQEMQNGDLFIGSGQGKASGDDLESTINALGQMLALVKVKGERAQAGAGGTAKMEPLKGSPDGNTWAKLDDTVGSDGTAYSGRTKFYEVLDGITSSQVYKDIANKATLTTARPDGLTARKDFGKFLQLRYLTPFAFTDTTEVVAALKSAQTSDAEKWDKDLENAQKDNANWAGVANFSDNYLLTRTEILIRKLYNNRRDWAYDIVKTKFVFYGNCHFVLRVLSCTGQSA